MVVATAASSGNPSKASMPVELPSNTPKPPGMNPTVLATEATMKLAKALDIGKVIPKDCRIVQTVRVSNIKMPAAAADTSSSSHQFFMRLPGT
jgi:hypothetical protein